MLKKLVALTLAALMLINPMTAFAVSWGSVVDTLYAQRYYNENGVDATVDDDGNVTVSAGTITDFYTDSRFASYTFKGSVVIDGQKFEVHVGESDAVLVNIESGVGVQVGKVSISTDSGSVEFNNSGSIEADEMFVSAGTDGDVVVMNTADGVIVVEDELGMFAGYEEEDEEAEGPGEATLEFINAGSVTTENLWAWSHEGGSVTIDNDGGTISMEVGEHENPEEEQEGPGELNLMADGSGNLTLDNAGTINGEATVNMGWEEDSPAATGTATVTNDGTINGNVNANLHDDANATVTNNEMVNGELNVRGWDTSSIEATNSGTADMLYADVGGDASVKTTNTVDGTVKQQHSDVHDNGTLYQTNDGTVTEQFTSKVNGGNAYNTNNGIIEGYVGTNVRGEGSAEVTNNGTIDNVGSFSEGYDEEGNLVSWADGVGFEVNDGGSLTVTNTGTIETEDVYIRNDSTNTVVFENAVAEDGTKGTIATQESIGFNGSGDIEISNSGVISTDNDKSDNIVHEDGWVENEGSLWGDAYEGGSLTFTNEEGGEITGYVGMGAAGEGSTLEMTNNGTTEYLQGNASEGATTTITNNDTVSIQMTNTASSGGTATSTNSEGAYAEWMWSHSEEGGVLESVNNGTAGSQGGATWQDGAQITITNNNEVLGSMDVYVYGDSSATLTNEVTAGGVYGEGSDGTVEVTNNGTAEYVGAGAFEDVTVAVTNNGTVTDAIDVGSYSGGIADVVNNSTAENIYSGAFVGGTTTVTNNDTVNNELVADTYNGTIDVTNDGAVGGQMDVYAYGEEGSATAANNGTVGSSKDGNGVWVESGEGGAVELTNDGVINGEIGGGAIEGGSMTIDNNGSAETAWINAHGGGVALNNEGTIKGTLSVSIGTQSNAVTETETVAELLKQTGVDISGYESVDIYTANQNGELIARYSVAADGTVVLEEVLMEQDGGDGDDPRFWTKERIRHDMEEKRKAAEIGGVYGSPYWLKQLYIGYMSLNLRLFNGEEQLLFKENISWVPGTGAAGEKVLTLNVKLEDTANLTMRLDGAVIGKLEQAGIVTINIVDGVGNLFMTYQVEDLKGAREMYGLTQKEYIVVGSADADVMKIAEDGTISPIEGETKPVEEVAEEAKAETEEKAAEGTPAA